MVTVFLIFGTPFLLPQVRLYVRARLGSSEAMYAMAEEYYKRYGYSYVPGLFYHDDAKGDYWLRKSLAKGNFNAYARLLGSAGSWGVFDDKEKINWLNYGCTLDIPWCAEELAMAYMMGNYGLPQDFKKNGKAREYDNLAVELHHKKGTLSEHSCILLPGTDIFAPAYSPRSPLTQPELHPGILRKSVLRK